MYGLGSSEQPPDFRKEDHFLSLVRYAKTQPRLCSYFMFEKSSDYSEVRLLGVVGEVLDRYVHISNLVEFKQDKFLPIYLPIETYLLEETLPAILVVPILFVKFEAESFHVNESISVQRLSDDLHVARGWRGPWGKFGQRTGGGCRHSRPLHIKPLTHESRLGDPRTKVRCGLSHWSWSILSSLPSAYLQAIQQDTTSS